MVTPQVGDTGTHGSSVNDYELRERLGQRGGVTVYRAYQVSVGCEVVLKAITTDGANRRSSVESFDAQCQLLSQLEHPHIVTPLDCWRDADRAYLTMPLLRGETLERSLVQGPWRPPEALRLLDQIGAALSHAHRCGIVHGAVRPSAVLLDEGANAYLSDFEPGGHSEPGADDAGVSSCYVTPEQSAGNPVGPAADVYCLAVLTCEILTGVALPKHALFSPVRLPRGFRQVIRRATDPEPLRRFEQVEGFLRALHQAFDVDEGPAGRTVADVRNPYKGLQAFGETDAMDFFGRDALVSELVDRVSTNRLTAVVGPSGSGKSSLVLAGLIPVARRGNLGGRPVIIAQMSPGSDPFQELHAALVRASPGRPTNLRDDLRTDEGGLLRASRQILESRESELLLIIDQFEELFVLTRGEPVRQSFIAQLVTAANDERSRIRVVLTMRSDFLDQPPLHPRFAELLNAASTTVTLPSDSSLARAITEPAQRLGLHVEPGLVPTILRDVDQEPGALPMLQCVLTELADACRGGPLTIAEYDRLGGVVGAAARWAEDIYAGLSTPGRTAAREMFVRLVSVGDEADDTRRRIGQTDLDVPAIDPHALETVMSTYGSSRLLSFDHDPITNGRTVQIAHEGLIREWPRYREWIDERRGDLRTQQRLASAVTEWRQADRDPGFLMSGTRLETFEKWADSTAVSFTSEEQAFLTESRVEEERRSTAAATRRRLALAAIAALAVMSLAGALGVLAQRNRASDLAAEAGAQSAVAIEAEERAERLRNEAQRGASIDQARAVVQRARSLDDPDLKLLLALEAQALLETADTDDVSVTSALYQFAFDHRVDSRIRVESDLVTVESSPDGTMFVTTSILEPTASIVDARAEVVLASLDLPGDAFGSTWLADEGLLATGQTDGTIQIWNPAGDGVTSVDAARRPVRPLFTIDGQLVYAQFASTQPGLLFRVVALEGIGGDSVFRTQQVAVEAVASPSGRQLMVVEVGDVLRIYSTETWEDVTTAALQAALLGTEVRDAAFSASGEQIWVLGAGRLRLLDVRTGEEISAFDTNISGASFVEPSDDGQLLAVGSPSEPVHVFDAASGQEVAELHGSIGALTEQRNLFRWGLSVTWISDRRLVVSQPGAIVVWDFGIPNAEVAFWPGRTPPPTVTYFTPSGDLVLGSDRGGVEIFDATGALKQSFAPRGQWAVPALASADGSTVAVPGDNAVEVIDIADRVRVRSIGPDGFSRPLALSHDGRLLVAGTSREPDDARHTVAIIDAETGEQRHRIGSRLDGERAAFTSDDTIAAIPIARVVNETALPGSGLWLIDTANGSLINRGPPQNCITAVAISSDDASAATVGCDGNVSLFDMELLIGEEPWQARIGGELDDGTAGVGVTFAPGDDIVIVTRADGRIEAFEADARFARLWSFDIGDHVGAPVVRNGRVWAGTTRNPETEASGGVVAMPLDVDQLVLFAQGTVTRELSDDECREFLERPTCSGS